MENSDLLRRAEDLLRRCEKNGTVTATHFLTPAERLALERWKKTQPGCRLFFSGGHPDCERTVGFFLPDYMEEDWLPLDETIRAFALTAAFAFLPLPPLFPFSRPLLSASSPSAGHVGPVWTLIS